MTRHASTQVNQNQLKELQQVTQPQEHTHTHAPSQRRHEQSVECTGDQLCPIWSYKTGKSWLKSDYMKLA